MTTSSLLADMVKQLEDNADQMVSITKESLFGLIAQLKAIHGDNQVFSVPPNDIDKIEVVWRKNGDCSVKVTESSLIKTFHFDNKKPLIRKKRTAYKRKEICDE